MISGRQSTIMERVSATIVDRRGTIILLFLAAVIFSVFSRNWVQVCENLTAYLPENTETRMGLDLMEREFTTFGTADLMVENVTYDQAAALAEQLEQIPGVKSVEFENDEKHYAQAAALFTLTFDGEKSDQISVDALNEAKAMLSHYDLYVDSEVGNPLRTIVDREMLIVDLISVVIITLVLLFTSRTYGEIPVLLLTFGAAALLNMGTNYLMGEISFVTDSIATVLQLALAIDYAIILCHRYTEEHRDKPAREAAVAALSKAIPEISASSLTTIAGLLALCFMQFQLGRDVGVVLIKAIFLSLCSVFLLMPGLLVLFTPLIDRTHHRSFVPRIDFLGRGVYATRFVMPVLFLGVFVAATIFSNKVNYVYSPFSIPAIRKNEMVIAQERIEEVFGRTNQMALLVPSGDGDKEAALIKDLEELNHTESVIGLANIEAIDGHTLTDELTPRQFAELTELDYEVAKVLYSSYAMNREDYGQIITNLDNYRITLIDLFDYLLEKRDEVTLDLDEETEERLDDLKSQIRDAKLQLRSGNWSRIVIELNLPTESKTSYDYLEVIHGLTARYYDEYYLVGDTTSCSDLKTSFQNDNVHISVLTITFVIIILLLTFKSAGLPLLLILIIQGSIFVNFSVPYLKGDNLYFLTYLLISAIQMGANIDYAIVISSRYLELRKQKPLKEAMIETLNLAFPTVITSGTILASAGVAIGLFTSNQTISAIGVYLGAGTLISIFLVMCVLPQILLMGDIVIKKTSFDLSKSNRATQRVGLMRIDGRVRGNLDGLIDAEVHGVFRGTLNAIIDIGSVEDVDSALLPENHETGVTQS